MLVLVLSAALAGEYPPVEAPTLEQVDAQTRELVAAAKNLFSERRYAEAITKFRQAHALKANPANVYNIGKCFERLHDAAQALRWYREYLRIEPGGKDDPIVKKDIHDAEASLAATGVQQMAVYAEPPTAQVLIDGKALPDSPAYAELSAGEHQVTVTADGYEPVTRTFVMDITHVGELKVELEPVEGAQPANPELAHARALVKALHFAEAIEELTVARSVPGAPEAQRVELLELLATCHFGEGHRADAEATFKELLEVSPEHELDKNTSPEITEAFANVKHHLYAGDFLKLLPQPTPPGGEPSIGVLDPYRLGASFVVVSRTDGGQWREAPVTPSNHRLKVPLDVRLGHPVDWYLEARAVDGRVLASLGTADEPEHCSVAMVGSVSLTQPAPRAQRVPAWVAVAVAVAAGVAGAILQVQSGQLSTRAASGQPPYDWADGARNARAQAVTDAAIATGLFVGAGLATTSGVVFFAW